MRKEQRIPKSKIPEAIEALKALDKKELDDVPAREAIKNMHRQIERVLKLGYTYEEVSETLAGLDIYISPQRIKYFLAQIRKSKKKKSQSKDNNSNSSKKTNTSTENIDVISHDNQTSSIQNRQSSNSSQNYSDLTDNQTDKSSNKYGFKPVIVNPEDL